MDTKRYVLRPEFFGGVLFDKVRKDYFYIDPETTLALSGVATGYGRLSLPGGYTKFLAREGIIVYGDNGQSIFLGDVINPTYQPEDFLSAPLRAHLAVTYKCPLDCAHCFIKNYKQQRSELSTEEIKGLIDRLISIGTYEILVSGGEPLTRKDIFECLGYALAKGMIVKLFTNGLLLEERQIGELQGLDLNYLAIGFDGLDPMTYGLIRGDKGRRAFDRVLRNVRLAREKLDIPVAIQFTCTSKNIDIQTLTRLVDFAVDNDVMLRVRPVNPCGNTLVNPDILLDYSTYLSVLQTIYKLFSKKGRSPSEEMKAKQGNIRFKFSRRSVKFEEAPLPYLGWGCSGGYVHAFIDPYGNMRPCGFLVGHIPHDDSDNIKAKNPLDIWLNGKGFLFKRAIAGNDACFDCKYHVTCRGGCRVRALHWKHDINASDQFCRRDFEKHPGVGGLFLSEACN